MRATLVPRGPAGVASFTGDQLRQSPGTNQRAYNVVVPRCFMGVFGFLSVLALSSTIVCTYFTIVGNDLPTMPEDQSSFFTNNSWCFITPRSVYDSRDDDWDTNPCVDVDIFWHNPTITTAADYYHGKPCTYDGVGTAFTFCNTDPTTTSKWCDEIFDTVVTSTSDCGPIESLFTTPTNYSTEGFIYAHEVSNFGLWLWIYPVMFLFWTLIILAVIVVSPCSVRRNGPVLELRTLTGIRQVPLANVSHLYVIDRYNWCRHRYFVRGLRYLTCSSWLGRAAEGYPTVLLLTEGGSFNYSISLSDADFQDFMADNVVTTTPVAATYGTAVATVAALPVADVAQMKV